MQRTILAGLKGMFHFEMPMIHKNACVDEVDEEMLELLFEAGGAGLLPKDLAVRARYVAAAKFLLHDLKLLGPSIEDVALVYRARYKDLVKLST